MSASWLTVGAKVATLQSGWRQHGHRPKFAIVERVGKRDAVLDDGQRFNVHRLERREGGAWGWTVKLLPAEHPIIAEALEEWRHRRRVQRARTACEDFRFGRNNVTAAEVILACAPLTGVGDKIAALFKREGGAS